MSEVTKIHTVDGSTVTVNGNFVVKLSDRPSVANLQNFCDKVLVNINNVTYMDAVTNCTEAIPVRFCPNCGAMVVEKEEDDG